MWTAVLKEWRASSVSRASMRVMGMVNMLFCSKQTEWFQMRLVNDKWKPTSVSSHSAWNSEMPHCRMLHCWNSAGQEQPEELMDDNLWCLYYKTPTSCSDSLKRPFGISKFLPFQVLMLSDEGQLLRDFWSHLLWPLISSYDTCQLCLLPLYCKSGKLLSMSLMFR